MISRRARALALLVVASPFAAQASASELEWNLDPESSRIDWILDATAHKVRGSFGFREGRIRFDRQSGEISGRIVVDAGSAETGNQRRDRKMHRQVLESAEHPSIVFRPQRIEGDLAPEGTSELTIHGTITIRGEAHSLAAASLVTVDGKRLTVRAGFRVPYVEWGMRDPSVFLLRVAKEVAVTVVAEGEMKESTNRGG